jgi:type II secretory pathway predicted ATPase ExeA
VQPPASLKALGDPIYEAFYGLKEQPFAITTDPRFFYLAASHQRAFSELLNGLRRREGVLLVTGETGTGKTTLCRAVIEALGERTFAAMVLNPYMTGAEVLRIVLRDFGLVAHEDLRRGALAAADVPQLLDTLEGFLQSLAPLGSHAVIILDEAQAVTPQTLDQLRLLTALEQGGQRLVQLVLCGQAGLLTTLKAEGLSALNERITRRVELAPLPAEQVEAYIQHRLAVAGGADSVSFDSMAAKAIAELSRGLPRRINVLCDRALQEGRIEGASVITASLVKRAARAVAGAPEPVVAAAPAAAPPSSSPVKPPAVTPKPAGAAATAAISKPAEPLRVPPAFADGEVQRSMSPSPFSSVAIPETVGDGSDVAGARSATVPATSSSGTSAPEQTAEARTQTTVLPGLTFGQHATAQEDAQSPGRSRLWRKVLICVLVVVALAAAGYAYYAQSIPEPEATLGPAPAAPVKDVGEPALALPRPLESIEEGPPARIRAAPTSSFENGGDPAGPDGRGLGRAPSPQVPENSNQIN